MGILVVLPIAALLAVAVVLLQFWKIGSQIVSRVHRRKNRHTFKNYWSERESLREGEWRTKDRYMFGLSWQWHRWRSTWISPRVVRVSCEEHFRLPSGNPINVLLMHVSDPGSLVQTYSQLYIVRGLKTFLREHALKKKKV